MNITNRRKLREENKEIKLSNFRGRTKITSEQQKLFQKAINGEDINWRQLEYGKDNQSLTDIFGKIQTQNQKS